MNYDEVFSRHTKIALQFSGGKDSLAVLYLLKPYLPKLTVYFCNSGDQFPETLAIVEEVKKFIPNFVEVQGRKPQVEKEFGWSSDVIPTGSTWFGRMVGHNEPKLIDRYMCFLKSIMEPIAERMKADGITLIIRGQKNADDKKPPLRSGDKADGFEFLYPIETWGHAELFAFLHSQNAPIPPYYAGGMLSAPDCIHCTAWLEHNLYPYLEQNHPEAAAVVHKRFWAIQKAVEQTTKKLEDIVYV